MSNCQVEDTVLQCHSSWGQFHEMRLVLLQHVKKLHMTACGGRHENPIWMSSVPEEAWERVYTVARNVTYDHQEAMA